MQLNSQFDHSMIHISDQSASQAQTQITHQLNHLAFTLGINYLLKDIMPVLISPAAAMPAKYLQEWVSFGVNEVIK